MNSIICMMITLAIEKKILKKKEIYKKIVVMIDQYSFKKLYKVKADYLCAKECELDCDDPSCPSRRSNTTDNISALPATLNLKSAFAQANHPIKKINNNHPLNVEVSINKTGNITKKNQSEESQSTIYINHKTLIKKMIEGKNKDIGDDKCVVNVTEKKKL